MVPFFDMRLETGWATLGSRTSDEDYSQILPSLGKPLMDCFRDFYGDTALCGSVSGTKCGIDFFGADHVLFASDSPFGPEQGAGYIRLAIECMEKIDIPAADKEKINYRNAEAFFGLKP
jgi:aminocarboxymuconate-semialdehyde decarboxylase